MKFFFAILAVLGLQSPAFAAVSISCPPTAVTDIPQATETLTSVMVMNSPQGDPLDSAAFPSLVPDSQTQTGKTLVSTWQLYKDGRSYLYCGYGSKDHFLLFDVTGAVHCDQRITPYPAPGTDNAGSTLSAACH
jgi:hypothetical protein